MYADIIIDITHEKLDKVFQYRIPSHLEGMLKVGTEVVVPFGKGNKEINGYVTGFSERAEYAPEKIKEILRIAEESVAIESRLVALAAWMKESYGGTMIQALKTVIPDMEALIGNIIEQEFTAAYDWQLGSALSMILMVFIILNIVLEAFSCHGAEEKVEQAEQGVKS